jgi:hypothetical protein
MSAKQLQAYIEDARVFDWKTHNCIHWGANWVKVCTGKEVIPQCDMPDGQDQVRATLKQLSLQSIADAVTSALGDPIHPNMAQTGDIVLLKPRSIGICNGRYAAALTMDGVVMVPMDQAEKAWRVK